jgi:hypothetical protein
LGKIAPTPPSPAKNQGLEDEKLGQETLNRIEALVQKINDDETRRELREVLIKGAKLERHRKKVK